MRSIQRLLVFCITLLLEERTVACRVSMGKSEGKRPLGILRSRWEDNI
jgi:hypothetical protein